MYYCTGEPDHRNFDDYLKFNFISAGQIGNGKRQKKYSDEIKQFKRNDYFFAYRLGIGYAAFGQIVEPAVKIDDFKLEQYPEKKLYEIPGLKQKNIQANHDNEGTEFLCKVRWIKVLDEKDVLNFNGTKYSSAFTSVTVGPFNTENRKFILRELIKNFNLSDLFKNESFYEDSEEEKNILQINEFVELLSNTHNLILHGAPGTGKTYLAKEIAKAMGCSDAEVGFVQFHPSYDYIDFVEGLRPVNGDNEKIDFEKKDGVFKQFCASAISSNSGSNFDEVFNSFLNDIIEDGNFKELTTPSGTKFSVSVNTRKNLTFYSGPDNRVGGSLTRKGIKTEYDGKPFYKYWLGYYQGVIDYLKKNYNLHKITEKKNLKYVFIIDEINRGEISKIFGELFYSIDPSCRIDVSKVDTNNPPKTILTQYANMETEPNEFDMVLGSDKVFGHFFIPENVYIIGTMNDIDRSVEAMDFAFRRRFTFKEIKANENLDMLAELDESIREKARKTLLRLNNAIWNEESKTGIDGLSSVYHIGGAYFLKLKELKNDFGKLWEYHLEGLLREYLRGMEDVETVLENLHTIYKSGYEA